MKKAVTLSLLSLPLFIFNTLQSQNCTPSTSNATLDINNVSAIMQNGGDMWWDYNQSRYEVPKGSGKKAFFVHSLWIAGLDQNNDLHCAAVRFRTVGNEFWPGPIFKDSAGNNSTDCVPFDRHWSITKAEIDDFVAGTSGAVPASIVEWPALGNPNLSITLDQMVAPFVDANGDGFYNHEDGDHPLIKGDQAIYWIINDIGNVHTESGGDPLGFEIHIMAYAYQTADVVNNTTFYDYRVINKSDNQYHDLYLGFFTDTDLGNSQDDFIGCDSARNIGFTYNADSLDEDAGGSLGYGLDLPIAGIRTVKLPKEASGELLAMSHFGYFINNSGPISDPTIAADYYNYMKGQWKDGTKWSYGGNGYDPGNPNAIPANYILSGNPSDPAGWSECTAGNLGGDRRMVQSHGPMTFDLNESKTLTMAAIFSQEEEYKGTCVDVTPFLEQSDIVEQWTQDHLCENFALTIDAQIKNTDSDTGAIALTLMGSTNYLNYNWSNGATESSVNGLSQGIYTVTVSDENGCSESTSFEVEPVGIFELFQNTFINLYPNPNQTGRFTVTSTDDKTLIAHTYNLLGEKVNEQTVRGTLDLTEADPGIYLVEMKSDNVTAVQRVVITR